MNGQYPTDIEDVFRLLLDVDDNTSLWSTLPCDFNWLGLAFVAKSQALSHDSVELEMRLRFAEIALSAWKYFKIYGGDSSTVIVSELNLRSQILCKFGDVQSEEFGKDRFFQILNDIFGETSTLYLRTYVKYPTDKVDKKILSKLREIKNCLNVIAPYLNSVLDEVPSEVLWWYERILYLP